ncbi:MAG: alpha/beta hydrolase [Bdellovibrionota bacterium]
MAGVFLALRRCQLTLVILFTSTLLSACDTVFFYPTKQLYLDPKEANLNCEDVFFTNADGQKLHGWLLHASAPVKGHILFLHGNAQNISSHILSVYWLPARGYDVFLLDYRGYGQSEGTPEILGALSDAEEALRMFAARPEVNGERIILFGQSLGGAVAVDLAAKESNQRYLRNVVIDSAFSSFRGVARDKIGQFWLTWPLKYPLSLLLSGGYDPLDVVDRISPLPLLILHGDSDRTVSFYHSEKLYERAKEPKQFWKFPGLDHIAALRDPQTRDRFVRYLEAPTP